MVYIVISYHPSYGTTICEVFSTRENAENFIQIQTDKKFIDYKIIERIIK